MTQIDRIWTEIIVRQSKPATVSCIQPITFFVLRQRFTHPVLHFWLAWTLSRGKRLLGSGGSSLNHQGMVQGKKKTQTYRSILKISQNGQIIVHSDWEPNCRANTIIIVHLGNAVAILGFSHHALVDGECYIKLYRSRRESRRNRCWCVISIAVLSPTHWRKSARLTRAFFCHRRRATCRLLECSLIISMFSAFLLHANRRALPPEERVSVCLV